MKKPYDLFRNYAEPGLTEKQAQILRRKLPEFFWYACSFLYHARGSTVLANSTRYYKPDNGCFRIDLYQEPGRPIKAYCYFTGEEQHPRRVQSKDFEDLMRLIRECLDLQRQEQSNLHPVL